MSPEEKSAQGQAAWSDKTDAEDLETESTDTPEPNEAAQTEGADNADLQRQLTEARAKAEENWDLVLRAKADNENLRRRNQREVENAHKFAVERFLKDLLPVVDSLELGIQAAVTGGADAEKLRQGSELTLQQLTGALEKHAVSVVDPKHEKFDPERHQAMTTQESVEVEPNTVLTVVQKGYLLNERLVRPALVVVSRASEAAGDVAVDQNT
jgi:molecular chaperone GrpE